MRTKMLATALLAVVVVLAGCGDDDGAMENPLAPSALAPSAAVETAQAPVASQDVSTQNATTQDSSTVQKDGHGNWLVSGFTFSGSGPFTSPGSIKLTVQESQDPPAAAQYAWSVSPGNCGNIAGPKRKPTWTFPVIGSNATRRCTAKLDASTADHTFPTFTQTATITGVELSLEILVNDDPRDPDELVEGRQAYIRVEPSGEADPHSFTYWFSATCGGAGTGRVHLFSSKRWTPGRQGRCRIDAEARINPDGKRPPEHGLQADNEIVYATTTKSVTVGPGAIPDLIVSVSAGPITRTEWGEESFILTAVVRNVGTGLSEETPLYFYQSETDTQRVAAEKYSPERVIREWLYGIPKGERTTCTAPGFLDTHLRYAAWRSSYSSRASSGVRYASFSRRQHWL